MADYIIPPKRIIVKCKWCKTLYVPDRSKDRRRITDKSFVAFEECPVCGYDNNDYPCTIPLWKYNLIRFMRGMF